MILMISLAVQSTPTAQAAVSILPLSSEISAGCTGSVGDTNALIAAINTANSTPAVDTIVLGNCVYTLSQAIQTLNNTPEITSTFGKTGLPAITRSLIISGHGATIQRALTATNDFDGSFRLMTIEPGGNLSLYDLTLKNGLAHGGDGSGAAAGMGGAIFNNQGQLALERVTLFDNVAQGGNSSSGGGGGVGSHASSVRGGGPNNNGGFGGGGKKEEDPGGTGGFGGGGGGAEGVGGNGGFGAGGGYAGSGGGNGGFGGGDGDKDGGGGGGGFGGAIFNLKSSLSISNSTLISNSAIGGDGSYEGGGGLGGAVFNLNGTTSLLNSTIASNTVAAGTGSGGSPVISASIFSLGDAGLDSTGTDNNDLAAAANLIMNNTIVANTSGGTVDCMVATFNSGNSTSNGSNNLLESHNNCPTTNLVSSDPMLNPLQDNGGNTPTMVLYSGSPALDAGDNTQASGLSTDQRGMVRVANTVVDIGAFESQGANLVLDKSVGVVFPQLGEKLIYTIVVNNAGPQATTGLVISDTLPTEVSFGSSSATQGSYNSGSGAWTIGTLAASELVTLTITTTIISVPSSEQPIVNTAVVSTTDLFDPSLDNNSSSAMILLTYLPIIIKP